ncbi:MAG TPA: hypothetical protein VLW17_14910 [Thermoanaerobaculaceae bacterium]|nr:hypothetical protein [Thermoanaerobaculaceae bacterium]
MSATGLHELNQRYVRLTDRCRSQWTFYQFLQGLFKHLRHEPCPVTLDFPALFNELRELGAVLGHPEPARTEKTLAELVAKVDAQSLRLLDVDKQIPPSLVRRFFDSLRNQDEKVLLAIIKFYLDDRVIGEDTLDKLDILFTRLVEIPRADGASLVRGRHEIERLVHPLLQHRPPVTTPDEEVDILLRALAELKAEALAARRFSELVGGGALDRYRSLKRRLGDTLLHPRLLPVLLETTVTFKNRFRQLWQEEEPRILDDTNRVRELQRQLEAHPEMVTPELREALSTFAHAHRRFDAGRQAENLRRDDALQLRHALDRILDQPDLAQFAPPLAAAEAAPIDGAAAGGEADPAAGGERTGERPAVSLQNDTLLREYLSKIHFALELVGRDRSPSEAIHAREVVALRLEPWEVEAARALVEGDAPAGSLAGEQGRLLLQAAALRIRMDEEAREIDRLHRSGSEHLPEILEAAAQSLQRAAELDRRFGWLFEDALFRGETESLEKLHRSRFRLLRAYSGLWLIHNDRGGISPY